MKKIKTKRMNYKFHTLSSRYKTSRGFTLLFAALTGALVLAVGLAILNITLKQLILSNAGKATQQSFYTADSGAECALFLDRGAGNPNCLLGFFPQASTTPSGYSSCLDDGVSASEMRCFGKQIILNQPSGNPVVNASGDVISTFELSDSTFPSADSSATPINATHKDMCFTVVVTKKNNGPTITQTRGYNTCKDVPNRFERAIKTFN